MKLFIKLLPFVFGLFLVGRAADKVEDITDVYSQSTVLPQGYHLGSTYVTQRDLFVTKERGEGHSLLTPPGAGYGLPTAEQWRKGVRKPQFIKVITLLPSGTKLRVERVVFLKASGSGMSHATGMLRTAGVDTLINPAFTSNFLSVRPYGTLCQPDPKFIREEASSDPVQGVK